MADETLRNLRLVHLSGCMEPPWRVDDHQAGCDPDRQPLAPPIGQPSGTRAGAARQAYGRRFATSLALQNLRGSTSSVLNVLALLHAISSWGDLHKTLEMSRQVALVRKARFECHLTDGQTLGK